MTDDKDLSAADIQTLAKRDGVVSFFGMLGYAWTLDCRRPPRHWALRRSHSSARSDTSSGWRYMKTERSCLTRIYPNLMTGGSDRKKPITVFVNYSRTRHQPSDGDESTTKDIRWRNTAAWAWHELVNPGLLRDDSERGVVDGTQNTTAD